MHTNMHTIPYIYIPRIYACACAPRYNKHAMEHLHADIMCSGLVFHAIHADLLFKNVNNNN